MEKQQSLKEELERIRKVKAKVVSVAVEALRAVTPKLGQLRRIPGMTLKLLVQKSAVLGTAKILYRTFKFPGLWYSTQN